MKCVGGDTLIVLVTGQALSSPMVEEILISWELFGDSNWGEQLLEYVSQRAALYWRRSSLANQTSLEDTHGTLSSLSAPRPFRWTTTVNGWPCQISLTPKESWLLKESQTCRYFISNHTTGSVRRCPNNTALGTYSIIPEEFLNLSQGSHEVSLFPILSTQRRLLILRPGIPHDNQDGSQNGKGSHTSLI